MMMLSATIGMVPSWTVKYFVIAWVVAVIALAVVLFWPKRS